MLLLRITFGWGQHKLLLLGWPPLCTIPHLQQALSPTGLALRGGPLTQEEVTRRAKRAAKVRSRVLCRLVFDVFCFFARGLVIAAVTVVGGWLDG